MKGSRHNLAIRYGKRAAGMLVEFANTRPEPEAFERFRRRWEGHGLKWNGGEDEFRWEQHMLRETWEGKHPGLERRQIELCLGIATQAGEESVGPPPIHVDWNEGSLFVAERNLNDLIWLTFLQHSRRLGICANKSRDDGCLTPYFIRYRPKQQFCSDACAKPRQRESKRRWWKEHGKNWLKERKRENRRLTGKSDKRR